MKSVPLFSSIPALKTDFRTVDHEPYTGMLASADMHRQRQEEQTHPLTDEEREVAIHRAGVAMVKAHRKGNVKRARRLLVIQCALIQGRNSEVEHPYGF